MKDKQEPSIVQQFFEECVFRLVTRFRNTQLDQNFFLLENWQEGLQYCKRNEELASNNALLMTPN